MVSEEQNSDMELASEIVPVPQVQPEAEAPEIVENEQENGIVRKKVRHRKKALHAAILKQMEFYFSDSNLTKDRFLSDLVRKNPEVDLEIFLRFNKIRSLSTDITRIAKALKNSDMLQVSEDGTKVKRITPIMAKDNVDECTVYVQKLPTDADHEWLSTIFAEYGPIAYVSIPKFKHNNKIKGFAFVEFETPEGAEKCLKEFRAKGRELPSQTSSSEVMSITTYNEEKEYEESNSKKLQNSNKNISEDNKCNEQKIEESAESSDSKSKKKKKKRKLTHDDTENIETDMSDNTKPKRRKENDKELDISSDSHTGGEEKRSKKRKNRHSLEEQSSSDSKIQQKSKLAKTTEPEISSKNETDKSENDEETKDDTNQETVEKKKKRKKKNNRYVSVVEETELLGLQVMAKKDWKKLRNKYLDLQRAKMKQLKQHLRKARWNQWGEKNKTENECEDTTSNKNKNSVLSIGFSPGLIVKIELNEACVDSKGFKAEMKSNNSNIQYIDIKDGSNVAFIRCDSSETANTLAQQTNEKRRFEILTGEEEKNYWDKIKSDREQKIGNNTRQKQKGRTKLLKKAEKELGKHIKFDEV